MKTTKINPNDYNDDYYLSECDGYQEFISECGTQSPERLRVIWNIAGITSGMKVLDVGCGRGELISECIRANAFSVGIDYSKYALRLARSLLARRTVKTSEHTILIQGDIIQLPLADNLFDRVIMSDVIEHIDPELVLDVLSEIRRVLRINGKLIIHTMPNLWYYRFGYPMFRFVERLRGNLLPRNPRERYKYAHFHVNEQTPKSLKITLGKAGFKSKVWLYDYRSYSEYPLTMRIAMRIVSGFPLLNAIFCDDIFAIAIKTND